MLVQLIDYWKQRPADDETMVRLSQELQPVLWREVLARLDDTGQRLYAMQQLLFIYEKLVHGQLKPGPVIELADVREHMKKTLNQAVTECNRLGLMSVSSAQGGGGPGGARTHDPHNANGE